MTLAGFGVPFLGIDILKDTFTDFGSQMVLPGGEGVLGVLAHVGAGAVELEARLAGMQRSDRALKAAILAEGASGAYDIHDMELCLRRLSRMRRLTEQAVKAAPTLQALNLSPAQTVIEPDTPAPATPPDV